MLNNYMKYCYNLSKINYFKGAIYECVSPLSITKHTNIVKFFDCR